MPGKDKFGGSFEYESSRVTDGQRIEHRRKVKVGIVAVGLLAVAVPLLIHWLSL